MAPWASPLVTPLYLASAEELMVEACVALFNCENGTFFKGFRVSPNLHVLFLLVYIFIAICTSSCSPFYQNEPGLTQTHTHFERSCVANAQ